ncbi:hypothetical protein HDK64DRAFT_108641 [Phyllosticta capitalensis]
MLLESPSQCGSAEIDPTPRRPSHVPSSDRSADNITAHPGTTFILITISFAAARCLPRPVPASHTSPTHLSPLTTHHLCPVHSTPRPGRRAGFVVRRAKRAQGGESRPYLCLHPRLCDKGSCRTRRPLGMRTREWRGGGTPTMHTCPSALVPSLSSVRSYIQSYHLQQVLTFGEQVPGILDSHGRSTLTLPTHAFGTNSLLPRKAKRKKSTLLLTS